MPKKISIVEKREWLKLSESGMPEAAIASEKHRALKTIKYGIEDARKERDALLVRSELLKDAIRDHQTRLMGIMVATLSALELPTVNMSLDLPVSVPGPRDGKPEWELLKSHLGKRDPLWNSLDNWKDVMFDHVMARRNLDAQIEKAVKTHTGYELVDNPTKPQYVYPITTKTLIYREIVSLALGITYEKPFEEYITADPKTGEVTYTKGVTLAKAPGEETKCMENILSAFNDLKATHLDAIEKTYKKVTDKFIKVRRAIQEITMMGILPGRCRVCKRLGL